MAGRLNGHVALVTGSARGIGAALAVRLAAEGAAVAVVDMGNPDDTVQHIATSGGRARGYRADITDNGRIDALRGDIERDLGVVDILVNNAGIYPQTPFEDVDDDEWRRVFAVNVDAPRALARSFLPPMRAGSWGRVISIASNAIALQVPGQAHYLASKMAVIGLTRALATEYGEHGVTVNAVAPSAVRTPGTAAIPEEGFAALASMQSIKRTSVPDDLAGTVAFLASDDAAFITGQTLFVDGGMVRSS
ncbi:SDR family NAD(P)-dependent oxidoreductase [Amycolatopsis sp. cmx-4-68]|uniref:SDR family NAD(P)-dependent oxidoreductase n=1 Tax=Amycolatopsis sp. cmx-4-68 TaxID=2790938 RepID=UPI00397900C2